MRKINLVITLFFLLLVNSYVAQNNTGKFIMFKLYKSAEFDLGRTQSTTTVNLGTFSPAIAWGKGANFHEVQITSINFSSIAQTFLYSGGAEYSFNHQFSDNEDSKFQFFFGGGIGAGFSTKNSSLVNSNSITIPTVGKFINFNVMAIPRVTYDVINNIALDLSLSYSFLDYEYSTHKAANPSLPLNAQTTLYNEFEFLPRVFLLRIAGIIRF